jgi:xanthine/uracil/vitamin C permease (AzgA family)
MQDNSNFESTLIKYGLDVGFMLSGFFGALLLALRSKGQKISTTIATILAGTACANYLTPLVINLIPDSLKEDAKYGIAFMMGFAGLKGLEIIINKAVEYFKAKKIKIDIEM